MASPDSGVGELHLDDAVRLLQNEGLFIVLPNLPDERPVKGVGEADVVEIDLSGRPQPLQQFAGMGEGNAGSHHAKAGTGSVTGIKDRIMVRFLGDPVQFIVQPAVKAGQELWRRHPAAGVFPEIRFLFRWHGRPTMDVLAGVTDPGRRPEDDRYLILFRKREGLADNFPGLAR